MPPKKQDTPEVESLFPALPEDLAPSVVDDEALQSLLDEHLAAVELIDAEDPKFIGDMPAEQVLAEYRQGAEQIKAIRAEQKSREESVEAYEAEKQALRDEIAASLPEPVVEEPAVEVVAETEVAEAADEPKDEPTEPTAEEIAEVVAEAESVVEESVKEPVAASAGQAASNGNASTAVQRFYRRPPAPTQERTAGEGEGERTGVPLVAASSVPGLRAAVHLDRNSLAKAMIEYTKRTARPTKHEKGVEEKVLVASAAYEYPESQRLHPGDKEGNAAKIASIGSPYLGSEALQVMVASGGHCAPLTPLYDIPDLASTARPVRDALPSFQAERGGVSVPSVSTIGDIETAITVIEEDEDALGGTWATKSCQALECPEWTDVHIGIISHCREYGNLNARAWPEGIAHENNLTMAAHARTAEGRLLDRIKALSINVTAGAANLSAWSHFVYALLRTAASIRYVLRLEAGEVRMQALAPAWLVDLLLVDQVSAQFDRFMARSAAIAQVASYGIDLTLYLDTPSTGTSQGFAAETASAVDDFPDIAQVALFPAGTFLHLDGGVLELGIVRDSTLNSTNDYQVFGETFENVARIGPTQAARWLSLTICPNGQFPATGTAISC